MLEPKVSKKWGKRETDHEFYSELTDDGLHVWGTARRYQYNKETGITELAKIPFDRVFQVGDVVEYDSYNLTYTAPITKITKKSVFVQVGWKSSANRYPHFEFIEMNWDLNLAEIRERNARISMTI